MNKGNAVIYSSIKPHKFPAHVAVVHRNGDLTIKIDDREYIIFGQKMMMKGARMRIKKNEIGLYLTEAAQ